MFLRDGLSFAIMLHSYHDFSSSVSLSDIADSLRGFAQGYVLSMTGVIFPASMSSFKNCRSSLFYVAMNVRPCWCTSTDKTFALITLPMDPIQRLLECPPPLGCSIPSGVSTRLRSDNEWFATLSRMKS